MSSEKRGMEWKLAECSATLETFYRIRARIDVPLPHTVIKRVKRDFRPDEREEVLEILSLYGTEEYERERERVLLAILNLSKGSKEAVWDYMDTAKKDYRDVLFWSEYPEESRLDTPEKIAQYQKLFNWLGMEFPTDLEPRKK